MPIEPVERARLRDDDVPRHRDVVAARGRQIAHRHDERLVLARQHQRAPDHVRGDRRAARAVHAQDDRLDAAIVGRLVDVFDERVRTGDVAAPPFARRDRPDRVDHRDLRPRAEGEGRRQRLHVVGEVGGVLVAQADVLLDLVAIQQGVDEPGRERVLGDERPLVDQLPGPSRATSCGPPRSPAPADRRRRGSATSPSRGAPA